MEVGRLLGIDWAARVDFIVRDGTPFFLECDAAPLVGPDSAFAASFAAAGVERAAQLRWLVE
jgi:D-alanine-D-alanine ligase-like ATP-grasp enzyme